MVPDHDFPIGVVDGCNTVYPLSLPGTVLCQKTLPDGIVESVVKGGGIRKDKSHFSAIGQCFYPGVVVRRQIPSRILLMVFYLCGRVAEVVVIPKHHMPRQSYQLVAIVYLLK